MSEKNKQSSNLLLRLIEEIDIFQKPVSFTYRGQRQLSFKKSRYRFFKSAFGGFITFILALALVSILIYKFDVMINYGDSSSKMNYFLADIRENTAPLDFGEEGLAFMFTISDMPRVRFFTDKKYGSFRLLQQTRVLEGNSGYEFFSEEIPFSKCSNTSAILEGIDREKISQFELNEFFCPDFTNITLQGRQLSTIFNRLSLVYEYCHGQDYCASDEEMETFFNVMAAEIIIGDKWFNQTNYEQPVQQYFTEHIIPLKRDTIQYFRTYLQNNTLTLHDSFFGLNAQRLSFPKMSDKFSSSEVSREQFYRQQTKEVFRFLMDLAPEYLIYERRIYNVNNLLEDIGGLFTSMFFMAKMVFAFFQFPLFYSALIEQAYLASVSTFKKQDQDEESKYHLDASNQNQPKKNRLSQVKFSACQIFKLSLLRLSCRKIRKTSSPQPFYAGFYKTGKARLIKELDCIEVLNKLRMVTVLFHLQKIKIQRAMKQHKKLFYLKEQDCIHRNQVENKIKEETRQKSNTFNDFILQGQIEEVKRSLQTHHQPAGPSAIDATTNRKLFNYKIESIPEQQGKICFDGLDFGPIYNKHGMHTLERANGRKSIHKKKRETRVKKFDNDQIDSAAQKNLN